MLKSPQPFILRRDSAPLDFKATESLVIHAKPEAEQGNKSQFLVSPAGAVTSSELSPHLTAYYISGEQKACGRRSWVKMSLEEGQVQHQ